MMLSSKEVRASFLDFFQGRGHEAVRSSPCIPAEDPTLLFTNAGMNQFKDVFLGTGNRHYKRAVNTQKCIRASGKHNDLEDVGRDTYHHTFFEMLGNWSFGDYYKKEVILWSWELLTEVWKLPKERLYATVFEEDKEAKELWMTVTDIHPSRVLEFGKKENFWEMGSTGPCGPSSEIHIDLTEQGNGGSLINKGFSEVIELWNLVFIQYNRNSKGVLVPLPNKHVDTGMGLERVSAVIQNKKSNYDTDIFSPLFEALSDLVGISYGAKEQTNVAFRVIADHVRTLSFAVADGATPSNEGRGYVLRRILRRASRFVNSLGQKEAIIYKLVPVLVEQMKDVFPEISDNQVATQRIIKAEEESFLVTLSRGLELFSDIAKRQVSHNDKKISGPDAFKLYDTYGFPFDLTLMLAQENSLSVDEEGFDLLMDEQKKRARVDRKSKQSTAGVFNHADWTFLSENDKSIFKGYTFTSLPVKILSIKKEEEHLLLMLDQTPFYAESGGQIGDTGVIETDSYRFFVFDTQKDGARFIHFVKEIESISTEKRIFLSSFSERDIEIRGIATVDKSKRKRITVNHTATHLLHASLREILGNHVQQKGSLVNDEKLRFDFSHYERVTDKQITEIEALINSVIRQAIEVKKHENVPFDQAKKMGALAFFGDKYGEFVRVIEIKNFSIEFCGGTHVDNVGQIGLVKILSESSIASGIRRIEAVAGDTLESMFRKEYALFQSLKKRFGAKDEAGLENQIIDLQNANKRLEKLLNESKLELLKKEIEKMWVNSKEKKGVRFIGSLICTDSALLLKDLAEWAKDKYSNAVICFAAEYDKGKASFVIGVNKSLVDRFQAKHLAKQVLDVIKGGSGGTNELAVAGGKNPSGLKDAIKKINFLVNK